ncbi:hypothetical protein [Nitrospirillum iridis]|uniref:Uncharacterized protein n=1 Tax=Nitrospirillum iridis TaxID=765888 RepID=A0A7X0AW83_9PROT|nr:hypothetical protein [Nitrospirillum iridis]MBB6251253.1 hypothetical protein [Nitrospirillum iridis]
MTAFPIGDVPQAWPALSLAPPLNDMRRASCCPSCGGTPGEATHAAA